MFMGIAEKNVMDGQGTQQEPENTKEVVYKFMEEEMKISNPRNSIEFQRIHRVGKPKHDGPRPIIARFLRYADREMVLHQARKTLKNKDSSVFEDIPKELYKLRKSQSKKFKEAKDRGDNVYFSKKFPKKSDFDVKRFAQALVLQMAAQMVEVRLSIFREKMHAGLSSLPSSKTFLKTTEHSWTKTVLNRGGRRKFFIQV